MILGILSVVAAPRFIDVSRDANLATLDTIYANLQASSKLVNYKAVIEDKTDCSTDPTVQMGGETITLRCGYPCPHPNGIAKTLTSEDGITWIGGNCGGLLGNITMRLDSAPDPANCSIRYAASRGNGPPAMSRTTSGC